MAWNERYRPLKEGEVIKAGDECLTDSRIGWEGVVHTIGQRTPSDLYSSHRLYRRLLAIGDFPLVCKG